MHDPVPVHDTGSRSSRAWCIIHCMMHHPPVQCMMRRPEHYMLHPADPLFDAASKRSKSWCSTEKFQCMMLHTWAPVHDVTSRSSLQWMMQHPEAPPPPPPPPVDDAASRMSPSAWCSIQAELQCMMQHQEAVWISHKEQPILAQSSSLKWHSSILREAWNPGTWLLSLVLW